MWRSEILLLVRQRATYSQKMFVGQRLKKPQRLSADKVFACQKLGRTELISFATSRAAASERSYEMVSSVPHRSMSDEGPLPSEEGVASGEGSLNRWSVAEGLPLFAFIRSERKRSWTTIWHIIQAWRWSMPD